MNIGIAIISLLNWRTLFTNNLTLTFSMRGFLGEEGLGAPSDCRMEKFEILKNSAEGRIFNICQSGKWMKIYAENCRLALLCRRKKKRNSWTPFET